MPYVCHLSDELQKYAKEVLNEDPQRRAADIEHIRQWLKKQPHLKSRTDDWFILRFLRGCKFSLEATKKKIDAHYTVKGMLPEWFKGRDPNNENLRAIIKSGNMLILPKLDKKGRKVIISRNGSVDLKKYTVDELMMATYMLIDVMVEEDDDEVATIMGVSMILDVKNSTAALFAFTPTVIKKAMVLGEDYSARGPQVMHYINSVKALEAIFYLMKQLMKEKMQKRIVVHASDFTSMYEDIPQEILTEEYGGREDKQALIDYWMKKVDDRRDWILEQEKYKVDESKRPGKPKTTLDLFGVDGSFRKLNVD